MNEIKFQDYFNIPNDCVPIMKRLDQFKASGVPLFIKYCTKHCKGFMLSKPQQTLVCAEVINVIIRPCLEQLTKDISYVLFGEISGEDLQQYFSEEYTEEQISLELNQLCDLLDFRDGGKIPDCASKIKCLFNYKNSFEVAKKILKVAKTLKLEGNFNTVEFIFSQVSVFCLFQWHDIVLF